MTRFRSPEEARAFQMQLRERGLRLVSRVTWQEGTVYAVPSESRGQEHTVDLRRECCTCEFWRHENAEMPPGTLPVRCKHIWAALEYRRALRSA